MVGSWTWLALIGLLAWIYLLGFRGGFWRAEPIFAVERVRDGDTPSVVAIVPARNEADVVATSVASLLRQNYGGAFSVILVDDQSSDRTAEIARSEAAAVGSAVALDVIAGGALPGGWTGKMWAMAQGLDRAQEIAPGARYVWLTDADIAHNPGVLAALVAKAEEERLALVSLMVLLKCDTAWDRLLIPAFVFFFQKLYPFAWVNQARRATAAAAGGCMLVRAEALAGVGGIAAIRNELIDDCALARKIKDNGEAIWLGLTQSSRSLRAYGTLGEIWRMVARSAFHQLHYSLLLLIGTVLAMLAIYVAGPLALLSYPLHGDGGALLAGGLAFFMMARGFRPILELYGVSSAISYLLPVAGCLYALMTMSSAWRHWRGKGGAWKSRHYQRAGDPTI